MRQAISSRGTGCSWWSSLGAGHRLLYQRFTRKARRERQAQSRRSRINPIQRLLLRKTGGMILKASEFKFPDAMRSKFPVIVRASPPEGWPRGTITVSENRIPYRNFLRVIGAAPDTEFEAQIGEYQD